MTSDHRYEDLINISILEAQIVVAYTQGPCSRKVLTGNCQGKVEMSPPQQSRNVPFAIAGCRGRGRLMVPAQEARFRVG